MYTTIQSFSNFRNSLIVESSARDEAASSNTGVATIGELMTAHHIASLASAQNSALAKEHKKQIQIHRDKGLHDVADLHEKMHKQHSQYAKSLADAAENFKNEAEKVHKNMQLSIKLSGKSGEKNPEETKSSLKRLNSEVADTHDKAKEGAHHLMKYYKDSHHIIEVHHVPKEGQITKITGVETDQTKDASDILLKVKKNRDNGSDRESYHGVSYKNNDSSTLSSGTMSEIDSLGKHPVHGHGAMKAHVSSFIESMKKKAKVNSTDNAKSTKSKLKEFIKQNPHHLTKFQQDAAKKTEEIFNHAGKQRGGTENQRQYLKKTFRTNNNLITKVLKVKKDSKGKTKSSITELNQSDLAHKINHATHFSCETDGSRVKYYAHIGDEVHHIGFVDHRFAHSGLKDPRADGKAKIAPHSESESGEHTLNTKDYDSNQVPHLIKPK